MKLRDLEIAFKLKTQSNTFIAARVADVLHASTPDEFIDEVSIVNMLESGHGPNSIVQSITRKNSAQGCVCERDKEVTGQKPAHTES